MTAPSVGLAEAAKICKVSESTIRRRRSELEKLGAYRTPKGAWVIPIPALVQIGLLERVTPSSEPPAADLTPSQLPSTQTPTETPDGALLDELDRLRAELAEERQARAVSEQARAVAEAVNKERERLLESYRETINVQAQALRMVEPPRPAEPQPAAAEPEPAPPVATPEPARQEPAKKKRWWQR